VRHAAFLPPALTPRRLVAVDTAELVALEVGGVELVRSAARPQRRSAEAAAEAAAAPARAAPRRAVVAVLGHVDHGKTTLLDSLRQTSVAAREAGGITQHMGAFVVQLPGGGSLTFLDTPGHAAFTAMRARGAACTDIAVLVVAADDGVKPQTREALAHARQAGCPIVVALTKTDKPGADLGRCRVQLLEEGLGTEEAGGSVQVVPVSALTGDGLVQLAEALLLEADMLDLEPQPLGPQDAAAEGEGVVLEARLDRGLGPVATALLRRGWLAPGAAVVAGCQWGRVRVLRDAAGRPMPAGAGPSEPVELLGLRGMPQAGDPLQVVGSEARARRIAAARADRAARGRDWGASTGMEAAEARQAAAAALGPTAGRAARKAARAAAEAEAAAAEAEAAAAAPPCGGELALVLKADVQGTAEALRDALQRLSSPAVAVRILSTAVGAVSESDVLLASACGAPLIAFNVRVPPGVAAAARRAGVRVVEGRVIYALLDAVGDMLAGLAPEHEAEEVVGEADVLQLFAATPARRGAAAPDPLLPPIAGCRVRTGSIRSAERFRLLRDGEATHPGLLAAASIRRHRLEVDSVGRGTECGVQLAALAGAELQLRAGDVLQCVRMVRVRARTEQVEGGGLRVTGEAGALASAA